MASTDSEDHELCNVCDSRAHDTMCDGCSRCVCFDCTVTATSDGRTLCLDCATGDED